MTFQPTKFRCKNCQDVIWSRYSGEFRVCKCWAESHNKVNSIAQKIQEKLESDMENTMHSIRCILMDEFGHGIAVDQTEYYIRQMGSDFDDLFGEDDESN